MTESIDWLSPADMEAFQSPTSGDKAEGTAPNAEG